MDPSRLTHFEAHTHRLAQILYRCLEEVGSTKGLLYLRPAGGGPFRLACHYGWPRGHVPPEALDPLDPAMVLVHRERRSFAINEAEAFPEFAAFGLGAPAPRLLVTPLYHAGDWVGLLLQRDRVRGERYELSRDERPTLAISEDLVTTYLQRAGQVTVHLGGMGDGGTAEVAPDLPEPPLASVGLIPDLPDEAPSQVPATAADPGLLPWEQEQRAILGQLEPGRLPPEPREDHERRPARFLPEQRAYFWELAALLLDLAGGDAAGLWVEEPDELKPFLVYSRAPLADGLKAQILDHLGHHLPGLDPEQLRLQVRAADPGAEELQEPFGTLVHQLLGGEGGPRDLLFLFRTEHRPVTGEEFPGMARAGRLLEMHLQEGRLHERYHRAFLSVSHRILKSGEGRLPSLRSHSLATAKLARNLAMRLDLPSAEVEAVSIAAILHDVGTLMLDPAVMAKASLTPEELAHVRTHPVLASTFLKDFKFPFDVLRIIRHHHERWDGTGYPDGLAGGRIPVGSRIIGVIEAFEVMTSGRSYRDARSTAQALEELQRGAGTQFDPAAVTALAQILHRARKGGA